LASRRRVVERNSRHGNATRPQPTEHLAPMGPGYAAPRARAPTLLYGVEYFIKPSRPASRRTVSRSLRGEDAARSERSRRCLHLLDLLRHLRRELFSVSAVSRRIWPDDEIGRASCRGRVCSAGGAV